MRLALEAVWDSNWTATLDDMDEDIFEVQMTYETRDLVQIALKLGE